MKGIAFGSGHFTIERLCYNGKTDLCSDAVSIFELPAATKREYNRIQQYIDNGVPDTKKYRYGCWTRAWRWLGTRRLGFGPSISVNMGQSSSNKNTELSRVLGQQEAIVQAAQFKNCPLLFEKDESFCITIC